MQVYLDKRAPKKFKVAYSKSMDYGLLKLYSNNSLDTRGDNSFKKLSALRNKIKLKIFCFFYGTYDFAISFNAPVISNYYSLYI